MDALTIPSTWQDALEKHPIVQARAFEKQLRASVLRDREKLRGLVGSNYRDLLATAEQIVDLNEGCRNAESSIASLSKECQTPSGDYQPREQPVMVRTANLLKFSDQLLRCSSKATKDKSVALASKSLVLARLIVKHLEQEGIPVSTLQWLQKRYKIARQQMLRCFDALYTNPVERSSMLTKTIVAYCLTTSSTPGDAIQHFQTMRSNALARSTIDSAEKGYKLKLLRQKAHYLLVSVAAMKTLYGRTVNDSLQNLQTQPLLQDPDLMRCDTLHLGFNENLLPTDILSFTPYFKRVAPSSSEIHSSIQRWVDGAFAYILHETVNTISVLGLKGTLKAKEQVLDILLPSYFSTHIGQHNIDALRHAFSGRIAEIIKQQAESLAELEPKLRQSLKASNPQTLWTSHAVKALTSGMTNRSLHAIQQQYVGVDKELDVLYRLLQKWLIKLRDTKEELTKLGNIRWQDKMEEYDDDDEDVARAVVFSLSKEDPTAYQKMADDNSLKAAHNFVEVISNMTTGTLEQGTTQAPISSIAILLRVVREMRTVLQTQSMWAPTKTLQSCTAKLEEALAQQTASQLFEAVEHDKPAPLAFVPDDMPSPLAVSVLQQLCTMMSQIGGLDLWTRNATRCLQGILRDRISSSEGRQYYARSELDDQYLRIALGGSTGQSTSEAVPRKAAAHWNKTKILFGILNI